MRASRPCVPVSETRLSVLVPRTGATGHNPSIPLLTTDFLPAKVSSDDTFRTFMDKAQGALAFDEYKKAVVKASSLEHGAIPREVQSAGASCSQAALNRGPFCAGPPKEKHVQMLLAAIQDGSNPKEIFYEITQRWGFSI